MLHHERHVQLSGRPDDTDADGRAGDWSRPVSRVRTGEEVDARRAKGTTEKNPTADILSK